MSFGAGFGQALAQQVAQTLQSNRDFVMKRKLAEMANDADIQKELKKLEMQRDLFSSYYGNNSDNSNYVSPDGKSKYNVYGYGDTEDAFLERGTNVKNPLTGQSQLYTDPAQAQRAVQTLGTLQKRIDPKTGKETYFSPEALAKAAPTEQFEQVLNDPAKLQEFNKQITQAPPEVNMQSAMKQLRPLSINEFAQQNAALAGFDPSKIPALYKEYTKQYKDDRKSAETQMYKENKGFADVPDAYVGTLLADELGSKRELAKEDRKTNNLFEANKIAQQTVKLPDGRAMSDDQILAISRAGINIYDFQQKGGNVEKLLATLPAQIEAIKQRPIMNNITIQQKSLNLQEDRANGTDGTGKNRKPGGGGRVKEGYVFDESGYLKAVREYENGERRRKPEEDDFLMRKSKNDALNAARERLNRNKPKPGGGGLPKSGAVSAFQKALKSKPF